MEKTLYELEEAIRAAVNSPETAYQIEQTQPFESLGDLFTDRLLLVRLIRRGLSFALFEKIQRFSPFSESDWAGFLEMSTKSLQRYKTATQFYFKTIHSEKIMEILEIMHKGSEVFGSMEKFEHWLHTPNHALGNEKPADLLTTSYGKELILTELVHIDHGIFA